MALVCSMEEAQLVYKAAWSSLLGGSIQYFYHDTPDLACATYAVFLSSLLYWCLPTYGIRRNLDMMTVGSVLLYYNYVAYGLEHVFGYYVFTGCGILSFFVGWLLHRRGYTMAGTYSHCNVHYCANIGNLALSAAIAAGLKNK